MRRGLPVPPTRTAGPLRVPAPASPTVPSPGSGPSGPLPLVVLVVIVIVIVIVIVGIFIVAVVALVQRVDTGIDRPRARSGTHVGLLRMRAELFG